MKALILDAGAVFFDFDGVIADSHDVKTRAFAALYADEYPHIVPDVIAYHDANGGLSRFKKFDYFERVLIGREPTAARLQSLSDRFATAVVDAVVESAEVPGVGALLDALNRRAKRCYVASGTPEEELKEIVARRKLTPYFHTVRGSPAEKTDILAGLSVENGHSVPTCVMIGDAMSDYRAAHAVGMQFIGVVQRGASPFPAGTMTISNFWGLAESVS